MLQIQQFGLVLAAQFGNGVVADDCLQEVFGEGGEAHFEDIACLGILLFEVGEYGFVFG